MIEAEGQTKSPMILGVGALHVSEGSCAWPQGLGCGAASNRGPSRLKPETSARG